MTASLPRALRPRVFGILACGLAVTTLVGCYQGSSFSEEPAPADSVKVGYGEDSRAQTGGAVQSVTADQMRPVTVPRVEQLLEGRFPGVEVIRTRDGGFLIRIRGRSTILGDQEPLYVVDGIAVQVEPGHGLDFLSPADIERIDVLKDPAETSMYGVRGANGVVLITTKKPR